MTGSSHATPNPESKSPESTNHEFYNALTQWFWFAETAMNLVSV